MLFGAGRRIVCCSLLAAALLGSADVRAEKPAAAQMQHWPAEKILPAEPGRKACWYRVYDAKLLAAHPRQKVTELTFFLRVSGYDAGGAYVFKNPDHIYYNFALSLKRRGPWGEHHRLLGRLRPRRCYDRQTLSQRRSVHQS